MRSSWLSGLDFREKLLRFEQGLTQTTVMAVVGFFEMTSSRRMRY
jgi:hypothetical protein